MNIGVHAAARRDRSPTCRRPPTGPSAAIDKDGGGGRRATPTTRCRPPAFVWKTIADPFAGRITMFRGRVRDARRPIPTVHNKTSDAAERLGHLLLLQGKTQTSVPEIKAGDLGAVAKLKDTLTNDTLGDKTDADHLPADHSSPSRCCLRDRAEEPRRRGQDQHRRCTGSRKRTRRSATAAIRRPRSCCSPGRASCTSRSPSRS